MAHAQSVGLLALLGGEGGPSGGVDGVGYHHAFIKMVPKQRGIAGDDVVRHDDTVGSVQCCRMTAATPFKHSRERTMSACQWTISGGSLL